MLNSLNSVEADEEVVDDFRSKISNIISGKNETEVFNCDETGLSHARQNCGRKGRCS